MPSYPTLHPGLGMKYGVDRRMRRIQGQLSTSLALAGFGALVPYTGVGPHREDWASSLSWCRNSRSSKIVFFPSVINGNMVGFYTALDAAPSEQIPAARGQGSPSKHERRALHKAETLNFEPWDLGQMQWQPEAANYLAWVRMGLCHLA